MIITLAWHWWMAPMLIILLGFYFIYRASKDFHDFGSAFAFIGCAIAAVAVTVGHYL